MNASTRNQPIQRVRRVVLGQLVTLALYGLGADHELFNGDADVQLVADAEQRADHVDE